MKIPLSLLRKWLAQDCSPAHLATTLTNAGLEVDSIDSHVAEISLTPNLSHAMSVLGVARELSALLDIPLKPLEWGPLLEGSTRTDELLDLTVENPLDCPLYMARVIEGVKVTPSPKWLQADLALFGIRSINNVVDVTNYVMQLLGQPLHAFDLAKITGKKLIVRRGQTAEKLQLLDERTADLNDQMLVIADDGGPLALAGVMGGKSSGVGEKTSSIVLEAAHFCPKLIRRTAKQSHTSTESSKRFERGHDPNLCPLALDYAAYLIQKLAGGQIAKAPLLFKAHDFLPKTLGLRLDRLHKLLGLQLSQNEVMDFLRRLSFTVTSSNPLQVAVPTYRADITAEIDLIEEVARLYGYNNLPRGTPAFHLSSIPENPFYRFCKEMEEKALRLGLQQLLTSDLVGLEGNDPSYIHVMNASNREQSLLRPSLLPGLLRCLEHNCNFQEPDLQGFEIGRVHYRLNNQLLEEEKMGIILHGKAGLANWSTPSRLLDFYDIKGLITSLLGADVAFKAAELPLFHPHQQLLAFKGQNQVAILGQLKDRPVFFAEIDLTLLATLPIKRNTFTELAHYPAIERDLTITLKEETTLQEILKVVQGCGCSWLEEVQLASIFRHESIGKGFKNLCLSFHFRSPHKTLSCEEAEKEFAHIKGALEAVYAKK